MKVAGWKNLWQHGDHPRARKLAKALWDEVTRILMKDGKEPTRLQVGELDEETCFLFCTYTRKNRQSTDANP